MNYSMTTIPFNDETLEEQIKYYTKRIQLLKQRAIITYRLDSQCDKQTLKNLLNYKSKPVHDVDCLIQAQEYRERLVTQIAGVEKGIGTMEESQRIFVESTILDSLKGQLISQDRYISEIQKDLEKGSISNEKES